METQEERLMRTMNEVVEANRRDSNAMMADLVTIFAAPLPVIDIQHYVPSPFDMSPFFTAIQGDPSIKLVREEMTSDFRKEAVRLPDISAFLATVDSQNANRASQEITLDPPQKIAAKEMK